uniref:Guanylate cyclase n=1 Tax=Cacopsylla melanoneura TaxID=428564 RepID=A0A8D8RBI4_9HEMI
MVNVSVLSLVSLLLLPTLLPCEEFTLGYLTGSQRLPGDKEYARPGLTISGAISLAVAEVNAPDGVLGSRGHRLNFVVAETYGEETHSIRQTASLWTRNVSAYIGPQETCTHEGRMAAAFDIVMISYFCTDYETSDKTFFPTFARTRPPISQISKSVAAVLLAFQWSQVAFFYLNSPEYAEFGKIASSIIGVLENVGILVTIKKWWDAPYHHGYSENPFISLVQETYTDVRIYVILGHYYEHLGLMVAMEELRLFDKGEYFVVGVDIEQYDSRDPEKYLRGMLLDNPDPVAQAAYRSYIGVLPSAARGYENFTEQVNYYCEQPPFNFVNPLKDIGANKIIRPEAAYLYDAVYLYANALVSTLEAGESVRNTTAIMQRFYRTHYHSVLGYMVYMDEHGDAEGNYSLVGRQMGPSGYGLYPVGVFTRHSNMSLPMLSLTQGIDWISGYPPLAEPPCGFRGEKCVSHMELIAGVVGGVALIIFIILLVVYRNWRYEQELDSLLWKLDYRDIQLNDTYKLNRNMHTSQVSLSSNPDTDFRYSAIFTPIGIYKGRIFAIKKIPKKSVDITRAMKKELKIIRDLRHDNLNGFIGACTEPPNICIVTEYCARGSLKDIMENEDVKLDHMFIASLVADILRGMLYLTDSPLRCHGNLKASNCLVDSRWVVKLSDFGLSEFKKDADYGGANGHSFLQHTYHLGSRGEDSMEYLHCKCDGLLYKAPELLRALISSPSGATLGSPKGDVYSFGIILYELHSRQGPFGDLGISPATILTRVMYPPCPQEPFRPRLDLLENSFDFVRDCAVECWAEIPDDRPDFKVIRTKLRPLRKGMKHNIFDNMIAMMEKYANNLEQLVDERTDQLVEEKKKTEALLFEMLPRSVAEQLRRGSSVEAESFDSVTIYFSDIVGFTAMSAESTPLQVVDFLNDLYTCFDSIVGNYDVYKVETIGDAYMVVGGLPVRILDHADQIATMALDLLHHSGRFKIRHLPYTPLRLRIGLHTGPCCAGVVGLTMPRYCLFGDTVNTASRLESTGAPWRIHLSVDTKEKLDLVGDYELEYRGETELKGKGKMPTYWLLGKKGFYKELPTPPPIGLDENLILYGRTGPSTPIDFTSSEPHNNTTHSTSFHDNSVPGQSSKENSYPQHSRSPKSQGQNSSKILSQILSLDSTIEDTRQSNRKKYKYMKQNTFDSCFYADSRDETPGEILVDRIDNSNYVNQSNTTSGDSERKSDKAGISLGSPRYNSERIGEKLGISDRAGSPRISIDRVDEKVGICDRVGSPRFDSLRNSDRYSGEKVGYSPRLDVYPRQLDVYGRSHRRGSREGGSEDNHSNSSSEDISPSTNSLKIKLNNECDALVVDRNQKSCSPNSKDSSPSRNGMSRSGRKDSSPGREGTARNNNHVSEKGYSTIEECNEEDRGHSLRGSFSTSSTVNDQGGSMPSGGNVANIVNSNITSSVNNQTISISSVGNSNIFNSICNTSHSSNNLSVQSSAKRFNKCKSIDTSIDEIKYDLVGVSFVNSRSNTNISTICNVNANVTSGGTGSSVSGAGKRKFSIGTNGGSSAYGGNTGVESNVADLSKPYNLYRCLNQGNRYLKRQYSVDKPIMTSESSAAAVVEGNKSVVKIQIHRE